MSTNERFHKDKSERWLLQHQAGSILRLAGITGFTSWTVEESSLIAPRRLPDGLVNVNFPDRENPVAVLIEIESYANKDAERQMFEDLLLARLELGVIPEGICVVLQPKGRVRVREKLLATSEVGTSKLSAQWKVVEVWKLNADELLAQNDLGLIPLVPLAKITGPVEPILRECRKRIERDAPAQQMEAFLVIPHIFAGMVYPTNLLKAIFAGGRPMIESPVLTELEGEYERRFLLRVLKGEFGKLPDELESQLGRIEKLESLHRLTERVGSCRSLEEFQTVIDEIEREDDT